MRNEQLLRDVANQIEAQPEAYDQGTYGRETNCGTTACIAGWACLLGGEEKLVRRMEKLEVVHDALASGRVVRSFTPEEWALIDERDEVADQIHEVATALLGMESEESGVLFLGGWHPADGLTVPQALEKFAAGSSLSEITA